MIWYFNFIAFGWALVMVLFAIPSIMDVAHNKKLLDSPNGRTVHELSTPRLGGLAIFAGFISALTIFGKLAFGVQELVAGTIIIFFIGLKDDIVTVSAFKKFFVQVLAAGIIMFMADIRITSFSGLFSIQTLSPGASYVVTFLIIIGVTNAINLIDGLDGLAGSLIFFSSLFLGICFLLLGNKEFIGFSTVGFSLAGAMAGFLRFNFHRAKIFMGDTGSLVSGFIISVLILKFLAMKSFSYSPTLVIAVLFVPLLDTVRVMLLRIFAGASPFAPDKNHIHHRLIELGFSQVAATLFLLATNFSAVCLVFVFSSLSNNFIFVLLGIFGAIFWAVIEWLYKKKQIKLANVCS